MGKEPLNYFNYYTEIEEHFQRARGTGLFLLSPLDWALIETWKESGVPLEAVLKGIDRAFEKWHAKRSKTRLVNSVAYCAQEVLTAAREGAGESQPRAAAPPFAAEELAEFLRRNAAQLRQMPGPICQQAAATLEKLAGEEHGNLEALEQRLTVMEDRIVAAATEAASDEELLDHRKQLDRQLAPYRSKMSVEQLAMLEKQYLRRRILEAAGLPRLSLFYL